jgi:dihydrodipicolinate synthase/N-acetylneuraminate lyase
VAIFKALAGAMRMATGGVRPPLGSPAPAELDECIAVLRQSGRLRTST